MTPTEKAMVRAILLAAKFKPHQVEWMVASCPSLERAKELFGRSYTPKPTYIPTPPDHYYEGLRAARLRHIRWMSDTCTEQEARDFLCMPSLDDELTLFKARVAADEAFAEELGAGEHPAVG